MKIKASTPVDQAPLTLTVALSTSVLFDMHSANRIFVEEGEDAFRTHMQRKGNQALRPGAALSFIRKLTQLDGIGNIHVQTPILSRMHPFAQKRVHISAEHHKLTHLINGARDSVGAIYTTGRPITAQHLTAMNVDLFLSTNAEDVRTALRAGFAAAVVPSKPGPAARRQTNANEIVLGYDFDRVLGIAYGADPASGDEDSEDFFRSVLAQTQDKRASLELYRAREIALIHTPTDPGPLAAFYLKMCAIRNRLKQTASEISITNNIITARDLGAFARLPPTLKKWQAEPDQMASSGPRSKAPHVYGHDIFFDDSQRNIDDTHPHTLAAHVPWESPARGTFVPRFKKFRRENKR